MVCLIPLILIESVFICVLKDGMAIGRQNSVFLLALMVLLLKIPQILVFNNAHKVHLLTHSNIYVSACALSIEANMLIVQLTHV